jgi:hypothetical protein
MIIDKEKDFYFAEKTLKERYHTKRYGMYETIDIEPNKTVYKILVSLPTFLLVNSICSYKLIKHNGINFRNLSKISLITIINYNIFARRFTDDYPYKKESQELNKFERLMRSIVNPIFVLQKDFILSFFIFLPCLFFNNNKIKEMNEEYKRKQLEKDQEEERFHVNKVLNSQDLKTVQEDNNTKKFTESTERKKKKDKFI